MSELDTKQKVLVAFYTEYQKDIPNMESINHETLGIDEEVFIIALRKLENEELLDKVLYLRGDNNKIIGTRLTYVMVTPNGLNYVENKLDLDPTMSAGEKVKEVTKKVTAWGYNELKDFAIKVAAELLKSSIGSK